MALDLTVLLPDSAFESVWLKLGLVFVVLSTGWILIKRPKHLPPGPKGLPIIGYLPIGQDIFKLATDLSKEYKSDVISMQIGPELFVFLNTRNIIKESFAKNGDKLSDRPDIFFKKFIAEGKGILSSEGNLWKEHRKFVLSLLKDFGVGKWNFEERIRDEINHLVAKLKENKGAAIDFQTPINLSIANILSSLIFGERFDYSDNEFLTYFNSMEQAMKDFAFTTVLNYLPKARHLPGDPFHFKSIMKHSAIIKAFIKKQTDAHKIKLDENSINCMLDAYLVEQKRQQEGGICDSSFTDQQLQQVIRDMFGAGTESTAVTLRWSLLLMTLNPDVQQKVQDEIDQNFGPDYSISIHDKPKLPYTDAVIHECHRFALIQPSGIPHTNNNEDVKIGKYMVPKKSIVLANFYAIHKDPDSFKYPDKFYPNHFYDEKERKVCNQDLIIPFNIGRRSCIGETVARLNLFIFFTTLLQHFKFRLAEGETAPDMNGIPGILKVPKPHKLRAIPRDSQ